MLLITENDKFQCFHYGYHGDYANVMYGKLYAQTEKSEVYARPVFRLIRLHISNSVTPKIRLNVSNNKLLFLLAENMFLRLCFYIFYIDASHYSVQKIVQ